MSGHANNAAHGSSQHGSGGHGSGGHGAGDGGGHHGHVIVPVITLRTILLALLFFTLLTVGLSKGEGWIANTLNFDIPQWVNVVVAMSIACVKTTLVVLFFMQLKYDSPLNSMIFIFTIVTVTFFLGFTMIDLGKRSTIDRFKGRYIMPGGTGLNADGPIVERAKMKAALEGHAEHHDSLAVRESRGTFTNAGYRAPVPAKGSTPNLARPVTGLTLPGFAPGPLEAPGHGTDAHGSEGHAPASAPGSSAPASPAEAPKAPAGH